MEFASIKHPKNSLKACLWMFKVHPVQFQGLRIWRQRRDKIQPLCSHWWSGLDLYSTPISLCWGRKRVQIWNNTSLFAFHGKRKESVSNFTTRDNSASIKKLNIRYEIPPAVFFLNIFFYNNMIFPSFTWFSTFYVTLSAHQQHVVNVGLLQRFTIYYWMSDTSISKPPPLNRYNISSFCSK